MYRKLLSTELREFKKLLCKNSTNVRVNMEKLRNFLFHLVKNKIFFLIISSFKVQMNRYYKINTNYSWILPGAALGVGPEGGQGPPKNMKLMLQISF